MAASLIRRLAWPLLAAAAFAFLVGLALQGFVVKEREKCLADQDGVLVLHTGEVEENDLAVTQDGSNVEGTLRPKQAAQSFVAGAWWWQI